MGEANEGVSNITLFAVNSFTNLHTGTLKSNIKRLHNALVHTYSLGIHCTQIKQYNFLQYIKIEI